MGLSLVKGGWSAADCLPRIINTGAQVAPLFFYIEATMREGFRRLSVWERQQRDEEIRRLHRLGCSRSILDERFGRLLVKSALEKQNNKTEGGTHG